MIRARRWVAAVLGAAVLSVPACNPSADKWSGDGTPGRPADRPSVEVGGPLYAAAPAVKIDAVAVSADPIVVPNAVVQNNERVQIASPVDATVELIGVPLAEAEPCDPNLVMVHPRNDKLRFRRLQDGDLIRADQYICRLDDQQVEVQMEALRNTLAELKLAIVAAQEAEDAQAKSVAAYKDLPGVSSVEKLNNIALVARYRENRIQSQKELKKTEGDLMQAGTMYARHWVKSPINGRIIKLLKNRGEFCKAGDPILEVQATDRVRIEGKLDIGYADQVRPGMRVLVEPVRPVGPTAHAAAHRQEVTGLCVTGHPGRPLVVSGGLDSAVQVWDVAAQRPLARLAHPAPVRSLAATGKAVKAQLVATGGDDGRVRLWDVANPDKLPTKELATFEEAHGSAVTGVAFSPDGRHLATAAGRDVWVWGVADRKKLYALPADHRDAVTTLRFTPQGTLVTAARDRAVRVWKVGDKGAALAAQMDHRGGAVDALGVSSDGGRVLFDKDAGRLDVVALGDERTVGSLQTNQRFGTLALFSNDDTLILTAGGEADQRGELTVWEAPQPGGRAAERRRLLTRGNAPVTCAAFSTDPSRPFVVVGTADGAVAYWAAPGRAEMGKQMVGTVVTSLPADARSMTLRVEMANPTDQFANGLPDRSLATIVIVPGNEPPAPAGVPAPAVRPAGGVGELGAVVPAGGLPPRPAAAAPPRPVQPTGSPTGFSVPALGTPKK